MSDTKAPQLDQLLQERAHRVESIRRARPASWRNEILVRGHPRGLGLREMMDQIEIDPSADARMTVPGMDAITKRYMSKSTDKVPQDVFRRVAAWYSDDAAMAQRMYGYISKHWFMPATPILTNGGTDRGLPISCLTPDAPILTPTGFKPIAEIEIGDKVLTHKGRWRRVVAKKSRIADNLFNMKIDRRRTNIGITGNHPVLTERSWTRVDELKYGGYTSAMNDYVAINRTLEHVEGKVVIDLAEHCPYPAEVRELELVALSTNVLPRKAPKDGAISYYAKPFAQVDIDEEIGWALGLWLAEGSFNKNSKGVPVGIRITVGSHEREHAENWLEIMKRRFNLNGAVSDGSATRDGKTATWINVDLNSKAIGAWFSAEFGMGCKDKTIPEWMLSAPKPVLTEMLEGFKLGDGCSYDLNDNSYCTITISNQKLIGALYNITLILGIDANLKLDVKPGRFSTVEKVQTLNICENGFKARGPNPGAGVSALRTEGANSFAAISKLEPVPGEHLVWDIQVEEDESFTVAGFVVHNCYLNDMDDTMSSIIEQWTETALLASKGGGVGTSYNRLREIGSATRGGKTSGAVSFAKVEDSITLAVSQGDVRRGSAAVYMQVDHPEIEDFLMIRDPSGDINRRALNLHLGLLLTDEFMVAVRDDKQFALRSRKDGRVVREIRAQELFERIIEQRMKTGEPYIIFIDTVNANRPEIQKRLGLKISMSNLCSEITLPTGMDHKGEWRTAVCCLSSFNAVYYDDWKNEKQFFDDVGRFIDNVMEDFLQRAPESFWRAIYSAFRERSVGLGIMGLHSYVQAKNVPYGSAMTISHQDRILKTIRLNLDRVSKELAYEKGPCPDGEDAGIMERFTNKMAIAPTASISTIAGGASPCTEPVPANVYVHKTLDGSVSIRNPRLEALLKEKGMNTEEIWSSINAPNDSPAGSVQHLDFLTEHEKDVYKTAFEIKQGWTIDLAKRRSVWVDQASSTNLFVPADVYLPELVAFHIRAWDEGVKTLYYLRSKSAQRAGNTTVRRSVSEDNTIERPVIIEITAEDEDKYFECESCQ